MGQNEWLKSCWIPSQNRREPKAYELSPILTVIGAKSRLAAAIRVELYTTLGGWSGGLVCESELWGPCFAFAVV